LFFFFSSRRRHTRFSRDWSSDVCSSDLSMVTDPGSATYAELHRTLVGKNELAWNVADFGASPSADPDINRVAFQIAIDGACTDRSEERRVGKEWRVRGGAQ